MKTAKWVSPECPPPETAGANESGVELPEDTRNRLTAAAVLGIPTPMQPGKTLRVCETCPFLKKNHRRRHDAAWYTVANIRRLWNGLRTGDAPGMVCHSTDPDSKYYGGKGDIKNGKKAECAGALLLILNDVNAVAAGKPQPFTPGVHKAVVESYAWRYLMKVVPSVEDRSEEVGLPWPCGNRGRAQ